ncbi:PREDICTED: transmembrane protein 70 homolog, mitochondrial [Polistes canadensis]|uniref:transmembrane protein 70 homolog, mitochondrial n=1 Tax=Polistes canadensis TaxID=91411 RepID=UPI000718C778|nr:PREDICTED: transmembrane protein 70 homolog, mitochondrial [Polistes canadensis]
MSLILRTNLRHKCQIYLQETKHLGCSYLRMNHNRNFKRVIHNDQTISEEQPIEIYRGNLNNRVRNVKIFSLGSSVCALAIQPYIINKAIIVDSIAGIAGSIFLGFTSICTTLLFHLITRNYVTVIYYDPKRDKYVATTYTIFLRENKIEFTPDDVVVPNITGIFTTCLIKGKSVLFNDQFFNDADHYYRIMGFDKPIDYKLSNTNLNNTTMEENLSEKTDNKR